MRPTFGLLALAATLALADDVTSTDDVFDDEVVSGLLEAFYGTELPASATGVAATSLAAALYNQEVSMMNDPNYLTGAQGLASAWASMTDPAEATAAQSSLSEEGYMNTEKYTTSSWYSNVATTAQTAWASAIESLHVVETSALKAAATATGTEVTFSTDQGEVTISASVNVERTTKAPVTTTAASDAAATTSGESASATTSASTSASTGGVMGARSTGGAVAGLAAVLAAGAAVFY